MIRIGDYVTRNSYNNDIIFKVVDIQGNNCILCGVCIRLSADSPVEDLKIYDGKVDDDDFALDFNEYKTLDRNDYFYLPGKVLHIDGDKDFLNRSMNFYNRNKIKAYGIYSLESDLADNVYGYLEKYNPDILDMTGHDALYRKRRSSGSYKNTDNFVRAVHEARRYDMSHEK